MPPKKFATVSFAAKPTAMPATPAAPRSGVISMPHSHSSVPTLPDKYRERPDVREHGREVEPGAFLVDGGDEPIHDGIGGMCPHEDDDRKRRPTEDSVEQLRVQEHGRSNRRDLREHVDAGERGGDDERARSEEMTMSSYAESVVETYRRATRRTMNSIPHGGDNGDHENCDRRLDR